MQIGDPWVQKSPFLTSSNDILRWSHEAVRRAGRGCDGWRRHHGGWVLEGGEGSSQPVHFKKYAGWEVSVSEGHMQGLLKAPILVRQDSFGTCII